MKVSNTNPTDFTTRLGETIAGDTIRETENKTLAPDQLQTAIDIVGVLVRLQEEALVRGLPLSPSDSYVDVSILTNSTVCTRFTYSC